MQKSENIFLIIHRHVMVLFVRQTFKLFQSFSGNFLSIYDVNLWWSRSEYRFIFLFFFFNTWASAIICTTLTVHHWGLEDILAITKDCYLKGNFDVHFPVAVPAFLFHFKKAVWHLSNIRQKYGMFSNSINTNADSMQISKFKWYCIDETRQIGLNWWHEYIF